MERKCLNCRKFPSSFLRVSSVSSLIDRGLSQQEMNQTPECDTELICNAEESETLIWLHVTKYGGRRKLILSPGLS